MRLFVCCEECKVLWPVQERADSHECPSCGWTTIIEDYEFSELDIPEDSIRWN